MKLWPYLALSLPLLGGCTRAPTYPQSAEAVREVLRDTDAPMLVMGSDAVSSDVKQAGDGSITWKVRGAKDEELLRFRAVVTPVDAASASVAVEVLPPEGKMHDKVVKGLAENPAIANLYRTAMAEQVDAALNHRKFNFSHIAAATAAATVSVIPRISKEMDQAGEAAARQDRERIKQAYRQEAHGGFDSDREDDPDPRPSNSDWADRRY